MNELWKGQSVSLGKKMLIKSFRSIFIMNFGSDSLGALGRSEG